MNAEMMLIEWSEQSVVDREERLRAIEDAGFMKQLADRAVSSHIETRASLRADQSILIDDPRIDEMNRRGDNLYEIQDARRRELAEVKRDDVSACHVDAALVSNHLDEFYDAARNMAAQDGVSVTPH